MAARIAWVDVLRRMPHRRILCFVDNDAARFGLMKGYSPSRASSWLLAQCWRADIEAGTHRWYDRVACASNPADGPCRSSFVSTMGLLGARCGSCDRLNSRMLYWPAFRPQGRSGLPGSRIELCPLVKKKDKNKET